VSSPDPDERTESLDQLRGLVRDLRSSRRRLAEAADEERRAIERDLHDGVQQHLVALGMNLRRLSGLVQGNSAAGNLVAEMTADVRRALDEAAELAHTIYPPLLGTLGLASALRSAAERAAVTATVEVRANASSPPQITTAVYRCWVDALSAASAGSDATARVADAHGDVTFELRVAGHLAATVVDRMRDRIEALGGSFAVREIHDGESIAQGVVPLPG